MNAKAVVPLIAGLGIAGLAGKLGFDYLKKAQGAAPKTVKVWAVNQDVPRGATIDEMNLRELDFPFDLAPKDAVVEKKDLVGRVPHTGVPADVPILSSMLLPPGTKPGVHVPPGFRAIAVKIDDGSGVDNHLQPGCHVDVVGYFQMKNNVTNKNETIARTIVENVEVAAVGPRLAPDAPERNSADSKEKKTQKTEQAKPARAVTLLVKPEHVPIVHLAEQKGEIKLSMRGDDDSTPAATKTVKDYDVTGIGVPEPEPDKSSMSDLLSNLMGQKKDEPGPEATVHAPPAEPPAPQYYPVITYYEGKDKRVFGWLPGNPDPIELTADEAANIFEDSKPKPNLPGHRRPGAKSPGGKDAKPQQPEPGQQPEPATEPQTETEQMPKELIG